MTTLSDLTLAQLTTAYGVLAGIIDNEYQYAVKNTRFGSG